MRQQDYRKAFEAVLTLFALRKVQKRSAEDANEIKSNSSPARIMMNLCDISGEVVVVRVGQSGLMMTIKLPA